MQKYQIFFRLSITTKGLLLMKYRILSIIILIASTQLYSEPLKVLHLSFHKGCLADLETVAQELNWDMTSWWAHDDNQRFEGMPFAGGDVYNINPRRADRVWQKNKEFFCSFDLIITSDTAPLSRIFLQNNCPVPLIVWVCNRFDYASSRGREFPFPDKEYYDIIRHATKNPNVRFVSYTPYEHIYAKRKGIDIGTHTIKPVGKKDEGKKIESSVPSSIHNNETFLLFPRLDANKTRSAINECSKRSISVWSGKYDGPDDLKSFKGVIFFPYAYSNIALFENLQRGVVHFVPTKRFLLQLGYVWDTSLRTNLEWCEWYMPEYQDAFVFFDSWDDLKNKTQSTDYQALRQHTIIPLGEKHRYTTLQQWQELITDLMREK